MMNSIYEIKQLQSGYEIIRYEESNGREAGSIHVTDEESMTEILNAMRKARMPFKINLQDFPRPKDLEKLIEKLLQ